MGSNTSSQFHDLVTPFFSQLLSDDFTPPTLMFNEINNITYEEFIKSIGELNLLSRKCLGNSGKQLIFAVKKGTDISVFWKATVQIACVKINSDTRKIETYRLLNLNEFFKVFKTLKCQYNTVEQSNKSVKANEAQFLTVSSFVDQLDDIARNGSNIDQSECCICLERPPEVLLPCAHSYCLPCIEQWNENNHTCPICRERLESTEDTWVLSEIPKAEDITKEIQCNLISLAANRTDSCSPF